MIYCQDCGAANDVAVSYCRICGRGLSQERGSLLCPACSQPIADQASFCSACGTPVMQSSSAQPTHNFTYAGANAEVAGQGSQPSQPLNPAVQVINEGLDLPDWLKRAAAEQPHDTSQGTDSSFVYTGINPTPIQPAVQAPPVQPSMQQTTAVGASPEPQVSWPTQPSASPPQLPAQEPVGWPQQQAAPPHAPAASAPSASIWPAQIQPTINAQAAPAAPPAFAEPNGAVGQARKFLAPEIPTGGLDQEMPSWLNQPPKTDELPAPTPVAPTLAPTPAPVEADGDTSSFISESDLPAWIRQLAEAEEARKASEAKVAAAEVQPPATPEAPNAGQDLFGEGSFTRRVSQLPGEAEPPSVASGPWLSRREQAVPSGTTQADVWSRASSSSTRKRDDEMEAELQPSFAAPTSFLNDQVVKVESATKPKSSEKFDDEKLRLILLIAVAVSVAAIAAYMYMGGGL